MINPLGLTLISGVILSGLHLYINRRYRKNNPLKKYSIPVIVGSFVVPFLIILLCILFYPLIDNIIGENASGRHGYVIFVIFFYPFLVPVYWLIMWLADKLHKRVLRKVYL